MGKTNAPQTEHALDRRQPSPIPADILSEEQYFQTTEPPEYLPDIEAQISRFVKLHPERPIAIVTSGGTTVPLENNTVRFIDNFSAGTRGATSAEQFMEAGYAVIFLHREFSLQPYSRHYSHSTNCFLDFMEACDGQICVKKTFQNDMSKVLDKYLYAKYNNLLLNIPFTTVNQYLYSLRSIAKITASFAGPRCLFYLAAAVSDFFLPQSRISEHKIQSSGKSTLTIELDPVPKFLRRLVEQWTHAYVVSFKLETDKSILLSKCQHALNRYHHQLVIGNLLQTRKHEVVFVRPGDSEGEWIRNEGGEEIESIFVPRVVEMHREFVANEVPSASA